MWHVGPEFTDQGSNLHTLHWKRSILIIWTAREIPFLNKNCSSVMMSLSFQV